jgi:hypothetical protein
VLRHPPPRGTDRSWSGYVALTVNAAVTVLR